MNRKVLLSVLILTILTLPTFLRTDIGTAQGQIVGTVCVAPDGSTQCPTTRAVLSGLVGDTIRVAVMVNNSDSLNAFNVIIRADHNVLRPLNISLAGTVLLGSPTLVSECIGGVIITGPVCDPVDGLDTVHVAAATLSGVTGSPITGLLFTAVYSIVAGGQTAVDFQTGCTASSVTGGVCVTIANGTLTPVPETVQGADFTPSGSAFILSASPNMLTLSLGQNANSTIQVNSLNFTGIVSLSILVTPVLLNSPIVFLSTDSVVLDPGSTASSTLYIVTSANTTVGMYQITVTGSSGTQTSSVAVSLFISNLPPPPGIAVTVIPSLPSVSPGGSNSSQILVTSLNGFAGQVTLSAVTSNPALNATVSPMIVYLNPGQTVFSTIFFLAAINAPLGVYTVTLTASTSQQTIGIIVQVVVTLPHLGSSSYSRVLVPQQFIAGGVPQNFHADDNSWLVPLNFTFPFYDGSFNSVWVSSNGLVSFTGPDSSVGSSIFDLRSRFALTPLWEDLRTDYNSTTDIYLIHQPNSLVIRWMALVFGTNIIVNFEVVLSSNGVVQFNYGPSNGPIFAAEGISNGRGDSLAENIRDSNGISSIVFTPIRPPHDLSVSLAVQNVVFAGNSTSITATLTNNGLNNENNVTLRLSINSTIVDSLSVPFLAANGTSASLVFSWSPTVEADYQIVAQASPVPGENVTTNNIASRTVTVLRLIGIQDPQGDTYNFGTPIDLAAIDGHYNRTSLTLTFTFYTEIAPPSQYAINSVYGYIDIDSDRNGATGITPAIDVFAPPGHAPSGLGDEYYISIFSEQLHPTYVDIINTQTFQLAARVPITFSLHRFIIAIPLSAIGGSGLVNYGTVIGNAQAPTDIAPNQGLSTSIRLPEHNVAVVSLTSDLSRLTAGQIDTFTAVVTNLGTFPESLTVTFSANNTIIATIHISLQAGENTTVAIDWDTPGVQPGRYQISVAISPVPGEVDVSDNQLVDGTVRVLPRSLVMKLTGSFDYLLRESIRIRIDALVTDANTAQPVSGASVSIQIYDDSNHLMTQTTMVETPAGSGIYEFRSSGTLSSLTRLNKGIYLVRGQASYHGGPMAYDILLFHIDPPPDQGEPLTATLLQDLTSVWGLGIVGILVAALAGLIVRRRRTPEIGYY